MVLVPIIVIGICIAAVIKAVINNYDARTDPKYYVKQKEELKKYEKNLLDEINYEENENQRRIREKDQMSIKEYADPFTGERVK